MKFIIDNTSSPIPEVVHIISMSKTTGGDVEIYLNGQLYAWFSVSNGMFNVSTESTVQFPLDL